MHALSAHHRKIVDRIFGHPLAANIAWSDVERLVRVLGNVVDRRGGDVAFEIGDRNAIFRRPHDKNLPSEGVIELRKLLVDAGVTPDRPGVPVTESSGVVPARTYVVVVDHHLARIFERTAGGSALNLLERMIPADPHGFRRHLEHRREADYRGERIPEDPAYYDRIIEALRPAPQILIIGDATGKSSAGEYLRERLRSDHADLFLRIVATVDADLSALTDAQVGVLVDRSLVREAVPS